jgi:hypothetical protein
MQGFIVHRTVKYEGSFFLGYFETLEEAVNRCKDDSVEGCFDQPDTLGPLILIEGPHLESILRNTPGIHQVWRLDHEHGHEDSYTIMSTLHSTNSTQA